jgi:DNA polymerase-3 subunit beta
MYLTLAQKDLSRALSLVSSMVGPATNAQMPVLKHLRLDAESETLVIQAASVDTRVRTRVSAAIQAPGSLLLPIAAFARFISDLPGEPVTLMAPAPTDRMALQLLCQQSKANFKHMDLPLAEFPQAMSLTEGEELLALDSELFKEMIEQVAFAASSNAVRPVLEGISVVLQNGSATFLAADTFRLALRTIAIPDQRLTASLLIPAPVLRQLARVLPSSGVVHLGRSYDGKQLLVRARDMDLSSRLLEGVYPDVQTLLTLSASTRVVLPTQDVRDAVHLMASFARENKHQLRCTVEETSLLLEAEAPDVGANEMRLTRDVTINGSGLTLMLNHAYLSEALAAVPTPQVALEFVDTRRPVTIKPVGNLDARHIIMPLVQEAASVPPRMTPKSATASAPR